MGKERDDLAMRLAEYKLPGANEALLERIVALAAATPQTPPRATWTWRAFFPQVAALACIAMLGFWGGNFSALNGVSVIPAKTTMSVAVSQADTSSDDYLRGAIWGETTWTEINL
jgi:hypothetical protein